MSWAVLGDVVTITGKTLPVTADGDEIMAAANSHVTIYCNRTPDASASISNRDLYWLKAAVCWQAAWLPGQPGYETRSTVRQESGDGTSYTVASEAQINLAPMAARALKNLSWKAARTLRTPDVSVPAGHRTPLDFTNEASDEFSGWGDA
jgi:hypothetical protein